MSHAAAGLTPAGRLIMIQRVEEVYLSTYLPESGATGASNAAAARAPRRSGRMILSDTFEVFRRLCQFCDTFPKRPAPLGEWWRAFWLPIRGFPMGFAVGLLRNYWQQARKTAELDELLGAAHDSTPDQDRTPVPQRSTLHRSVVKLLIEGYEAGASTYELADRYNVRRNTVRDTLRKAGFDSSANARLASMSKEDKIEAQSLFASGATRRELMARYGVSESTIRRAVAASK